MSITLNGTSGVTTPGINNSEGYTGDGLSIAAGAPAGAVTVDASGNVGVGTSSPGAKLHVTIANQSSGIAYKITNTAAAATRSITVADDGKWYFSSPGVADYMVLDASGNLLVGTTSGGDFKLRVDRADNQGLLTLRNSLASGITYDQFQIIVGQGASSAYQFARFYSAGGVSPQFAFRGDGQLFATSTSIQSISDIRVKENVRNSEDGLQTVLGLRPVRFDFKEGLGNNKKNQLGFIAQEIEAVFPDAVDVSGQDDENGDPYKSVGPGALIPVLVKAIQEQQTIINDLKARIEQLEAK